MIIKNLPIHLKDSVLVLFNVHLNVHYIDCGLLNKYVAKLY